ncbi:PREDICTED: thioredoxin domain-containing protein 5 [Nicrophorus vespilloides]|uniref:Thioredoxin domain-containing protein 5 n=1 Tax=Nicrophorus vespilloides TaxID=110193 RepID=A0ABM1MUE6_NICVS|nr:PREDICTED: thioredoxin domain-containing protein 5 [Nicrophorus vespilloides]
MKSFVLAATAIILLAGIAAAHEEDVHTVQYNVDNFEDEVVKNNHFVMFYAPWCGHCKRLGPTWEELAEMLNTEGSNVRIAKVDCTTDGDVCNANDVTGYPTLKFFKIGEKEGTKFRGTRDLPSLTTFINEQINMEGHGDEVPIPKNSGGLTELTEDNFEKFVQSGKHFIKFYAPWCGHCQKLAPVWEQLAKDIDAEGVVRISKIDCTQYRSNCNMFDIKGYPSLLWIEDGKKVEKYQGSRGLEELKDYVNKMVGTKSTSSDDIKEEDKEEPSSVMLLNGDDFQHGIESGISFVKFYAPWCGHCKRLAPTWEELGKKFIGNPEVDIVKVDCTLEVNKQLCNDQEVEGFPTVFLYKDGKKISEYNGNRSLEDLFDFIKKHMVEHDEL